VIPPPRIASSRHGRLALAVALVVGAALLLGACGGLVGSFVSTRSALEAAGFSKISIGVAGGGNDLKLSASLDQDTSVAEIQEMAAIVWRDFHQRFGSLEVTLHGANGTLRDSIPFAALERDFGARSAADNRTPLRSGIVRVGIFVLAAVAVVVLVILAVVAVLVRRRRRSRRPPDGGRWPPAGPGSWSWGAIAGAADNGAGGTGSPGPWGPPAPPDSAPAPADPWPPPGSGPPAWRRRPERPSSSALGGVSPVG
jgi:hypothetical protein